LAIVLCIVSRHEFPELDRSGHLLMPSLCAGGVLWMLFLSQTPMSVRHLWHFDVYRVDDGEQYLGGQFCQSAMTPAMIRCKRQQVLATHACDRS